MDIYYLFSFNSDLPGVNTKIVDKIASFNEGGVKVKGLVLYNDKHVNLNFLPEGQFEKHYFSPERTKGRLLNSRLFSPLSSLVNNLKAVKELHKNILAQKKNCLIIIRYGSSDYSSLWLIKKLKGNVIYESNTNEIEQLKLRYKGIMKSPLWVTYDYISELFFGPMVIRKVKAVVCVTNEIAAYQKNRIANSGDTKVVTISNGINVKGYELAPQVNHEMKEINLIMILGVDVLWNGLDKIMRALINQVSSTKLYVVGNIKAISNHDSIIYTGQLSNKQITDLIIQKKICAGVATLALERKGINEAAPLKVREYLARGLPVIYNYKDTDIDSDMVFMNRFCVRLKDNCTEIDLMAIENKLKQIVVINNYNVLIKEFATQHLDVSKKTLMYKSLIESIRLN